MQKIISQFIFIIALFFSFTFEGMASPASSAFEYVKPNEYSHVTVSPNGKYAAFTRTITNKFCLDRFRTSIAKSQNCSENAKEYRSTQEVLIYDLLQNRVDQTIDIPVNVHVSWLKFGNDTRILISLSSFRTTGRMNRFSTTVAQDIILSASIGPDKDNYEPIELTALGGVGVASRSGSTIGVYLGAWLGSPEIYNIANDDPTYVIARTGGRFGQLKRVSIYEDVSRDIAKADKKTFHWLLDSKGKPKVRVACDRKDKCENIETFYLNENGDWALIYELKESKADGYITEVFYPFDIDETTGELLVVSRTGNEKRTSLKRFDPIRRQFTELVYSHPIYDIENLLFDSNSNKLVGGIIQSDKSEYFITEPELKTHYDALATQFDEDQNFWIVDNNVSGSRAMIYVSSPHSTGKYYIYDPKTKKAAFAIDQNSFLSKRLESDGQALKIAMRDGAAVDAYRYFPKNQNKGAPLIIMPHGGPHLRDYFVYDGWVQYFVSRGYQVLQVNFRGSSGYGVDHEVAGYGQSRKNLCCRI